MNDIPVQVDRVPTLRCKLNGSTDQSEFSTEDFQLKNLVRFINKLQLGSEENSQASEEPSELQQEETGTIDL